MNSKKSFTVIAIFLLFSVLCHGFLGDGDYIFDHGDYNVTPLMLAAQKANIQEMQKHIKAGTDVNAVWGCDFPHAGFPVLRYAIDSGSCEAVRILLEAGADPNCQTESPVIYSDYCNVANLRNLPLLSHAINAHAPIAIVKELLHYGAHHGGKSWSALMIAAWRGYQEAVLVLLEAGADAKAVNGLDNKTALDYAKEMKHAEIIRILETTN